MSDQMKQIAQRIRTLREISDYTVAEVAGFTGLSDADYESYESGVVDIPISLLLKLSQLFKVDTTTILTGDMPRLNVCAVTRKDKGITIDRNNHYFYKNLAYNFTHRHRDPVRDAEAQAHTLLYPGRDRGGAGRREHRIFRGLPGGIFRVHPIRGDYPPEGNHGARERPLRRGHGGTGREPDGFRFPAGLQG